MERLRVMEEEEQMRRMVSCIQGSITWFSQIHLMLVAFQHLNSKPWNVACKMPRTDKLWVG